jgi:hypothetical protein
MVIVFGGFSARTNLALTVALRLRAELERRKITAPSKLADIISIYSRVNYAQSRGDGSGPWVRQKKPAFVKKNPKRNAIYAEAAGT